MLRFVDQSRSSADERVVKDKQTMNREYSRRLENDMEKEVSDMSIWEMSTFFSLSVSRFLNRFQTGKAAKFKQMPVMVHILKMCT
jgi:hypothetical protein